MSRSIGALHRIRDAHKRRARLDHAAAERARAEKEDAVGSIEEDVRRSRHFEDEQGEGDACWLTFEHSYRLRLQVDLRRARADLARSEEEAERSRELLREADRETRVVELAIERARREAEIERRRAESRQIDEMAGEGWRRRRA